MIFNQSTGGNVSDLATIFVSTSPDALVKAVGSKTFMNKSDENGYCSIGVDPGTYTVTSGLLSASVTVTDVAEVKLGNQFSVSGSVVQFYAEETTTLVDFDVDITAQQDLNGYSKPWAGGAGKNKAQLSNDNAGSNQRATVAYSATGATITATGTYGRYGWLIPVTVGVTYTISMVVQASNKETGYNMRVFIGSADGTWTTASADYIAQLTTATTDPESKTFTFTASTATLFVGAYVSTTATDGSLTISSLQLENGSLATAYEPYSNICPISGWSEAKVTRTGKNLIDDTKRYVSTTTTVYVGAESNAYTVALPAGTYTISVDFSGEPYGMYYRESNDNANRNLWSAGAASLTEKTFTIEDDGVFRFWVYRSTGVDPTKIIHVQIEVGSSATSYEAYQGNTYTIDLNGTRYGGTLDVISGVLTLTHGYIASYNGEVLPSTWLSDRDEYAVGTTPTTGAEVVYELATPTTVQLTAQQIDTLVGQNVIWADSGDVAVTYKRRQS